MDGIINVPVIIIGGGGCGLTLSSFLSDLKVQHVLIEKHPGTSVLPKAHYLNQRTMETFRHHGLDKPIIAKGAPSHNLGRAQWKTSLGGDGPFDGRVLGHCGAFGGEFGTKEWEDYRRDSPALSTNLPLLRLEPILRQLAEDRNPGRILFGHNVTDFEDDGKKVLVTVQQPDGDTQTYQAQFLVCADGGKLSTPKLGINMEGPTGIIEFISTHFKADLSEYWDDRTLLTYFINPGGEKMTSFEGGALVQMGPTWGRNSEEWTLHFAFPVNDNVRSDKEALLLRIRQLLKLPDLDMEVLNISRWVLDRVLADKYKVGRVFIAGDAAHRRPPTTGLGLNTSIEDARNIAWKLAAVLDKGADISLLETYETERRPIGLRNCDWGLFTFSNMAVIQAAVGLIPGATEYNNERCRRIFEDSFYGATARNQIQRFISTQDIEFAAHDLELGFVYGNGAVLPDGSKPPPVDPAGKNYIPTTRPGHRLPHAWIEGEAGVVISTQDLLVPGKHDFFIITDEDGDAWISAASSIYKSTKLTVGAAKIRFQGHSKGTGLYYDYQDQWSKVREIGMGGAILVRPDNFVAWRSDGLCHNPQLELSSVFAQLLSQKASQVSTSNGNLPNGAVRID